MSAAAPLSETEREALVPLLLRRYGQINGPILIGTAAFAFLHVVLGEQHLVLLLGLKMLQAATAVGGLWLSRRIPKRRVVTLCLLALSVVVNGVTAATGMVIGNVHTNALLYVATELATSSFLPWGAGIQAISVIAASIAALAPLLVDGVVYHDFWYDIVALTVAFAISIYIASEVEHDTLAEYRASRSARALAESRADFEGVFRSSNVLLALIELTEDDFVYIEGNDTLARLFGRTPGTLPGMSGTDMGFSRAEVIGWRSAFQRCAAEGSLLIPEYHLQVIQPSRWFHLSFTAIRNEAGKPVRFSGVGVDITELKQATESVRSLNLDLEAQVRDRTALLQAANKDLESFAYSVSHDLRTPLRTIEGFAAVIRDDHGTSLDPSIVDHLDRIRGASRHMGQLIDDMLMLSRASRVEMRREPVDVTRMARDVVADFRANRATRDVRVEVEPGLVANADPHLLRIVLTNLLGNAWKYTSQRDTASIQVGSETYEGERVFVVRDNGCGFDMRFVGKLFQPFQRLHAAEDFEGTGIGLATVSRIVRRHDGKVWAEGAIDGGAAFRFTLGEEGYVNPS